MGDDKKGICKAYGSFLVECMGGVDSVGGLFAGGAMNDRSNTTVHNGVPEQVHRTTECFVSWWNSMVVGTYRKMRVHALVLFCLGGFYGVFIDVDHIAIKATNMARPCHLFYLLGSFIIFIGTYTYYNRRF